MARRTSARAGKSKTSIRVDMSTVGKPFLKDREYHVRCTEASIEEGPSAPYFKLKFQGLEGSDQENTAIYHNASTSEAALWRLAPMLEAFGIDIPDGALDIDVSDFIDGEVLINTYLDRYEGGSSVKIEDFAPVEGEEEEEEDEPAPKGKSLGKKKPEPEEEDEEPAPKRGRGRPRKVAEEDEEEEPAPKRGRGRPRKEPEPEEEEEPKRGKAKPKTSKKKDTVSEDEVSEMSEEELEELIEEKELEVDLEEFKTLRKKRQAVLEALEENDLLEE